MNEFTKKKYFVGIDISKDHLDVALLKAEDLDVFKDKKVDNSFTGFAAIQNWLLKKRVKLEDCLFCMEHTGTYGLLLFAWLSQLGIDYCVEPGIKIKVSLKNSMKSHDQYHRVSGVQSISDEIQLQIQEYDQRIDRIDAQIIELIKTDESLMKNFDLAYISERRWACYCSIYAGYY